MAIEVRPLAGALGAEVFGTDIAGKISDLEFAKIYDAFLEHLVLFFREAEAADAGAAYRLRGALRRSRLRPFRLSN